MGGLSHRLVDAWIAVRLMRVTALRTIGELVAGRTPGAQAATAKLYASVQHQRLLELATELLAEEATVTGDGYALEPLQRAFLLSRAETIYGGSSQIQRNIIGERVLGLPREPRPDLMSRDVFTDFTPRDALLQSTIVVMGIAPIVGACLSWRRLIWGRPPGAVVGVGVTKRQPVNGRLMSQQG